MKNVILLYLLLFLASCSSKKKENTKPEYQSITQSVYASGIIKSKNQYQVFANSSGILGKILVTEGDRIKQGQLLFQISNPVAELNRENSLISAKFNTYQNNQNKLLELQYNITLAKQSKENDSLMLIRQRNLWAENIGTQAELEMKELSAKNSKTAYNNALLRYEELKKQLDFAERQSKKLYEISSSQANELLVKSQINGKVFSILKKSGEMVTPQTPLAVVGEAENYYIELQVDEYDIAKIELGQKIFLSMDSYKEQVFEAQVSKIYPIMNERSKTFTIEAVFTKAPNKIYPNLTAEANILISTKEKALLIPRNYLVNDKFVILENGEKKEVKIGMKDYEKVEIIEGLSNQDVILKPGQ